MIPFNHDCSFKDFYNSKYYKLHEKIEGVLTKFDFVQYVQTLPDIEKGFPVVSKYGRVFYIKIEDIEKHEKDLENFLKVRCLNFLDRLKTLINEDEYKVVTGDE